MADAAPVRFDPRGLLGALQRRHVSFVVIGAFARVVQGTDEITRSVDITPGTKPNTLASLELALADLHAERIDGKPLDLQTQEPVIELETDCGSLKIIPQPAGTRGYEDLRRAATYEHLGKGIRAQIASVGDLIRMGDALGREQERDVSALKQLRLIPELELDLGIDL